MRRLLRWVVMSIVFMCGGIAALAIGYQLLTTPEQRAEVNATANARRTVTAIAGNATGTAGAPTITLTATYPPESDAAQVSTGQARVVGMFDDVPGVVSVNTGIARQNGDAWYVYAELVVEEGANNTDTANAVLQAALSGLVSARVDIGMILDDGKQAISYDRNTRTDEWQVTVLTMTAEPIATESSMIVATAAPVDTRIPRPGNCSTAVAMGLGAQTAAQFPNLDRDNDGVACYGD